MSRVKMGPLHRPELMSRVLDQRKIPRRDFVRTASGLVLISSAELTLPGCDPETSREVARIVVFLFETALGSFRRSDEITGDVGFDNSTSGPIRFEGVMSLVERFANDNVADESPPRIFEVPPHGMSYGWGDLWAQNTGTHVVSLLLGGDTVSTDAFDVL